jgi:hypothetical protein
MDHPGIETFDPATLPSHVARLRQQGLTVWELSVFEVMLLTEAGGAHQWLEWLGYDIATIERVAFTHTLVDDGTILLVGARPMLFGELWPQSMFRRFRAAKRPGP